MTEKGTERKERYIGFNDAKIYERNLPSTMGKDRASALIAYTGKVYDLSSSFRWQDGRH